jgi:hypothetical protein
MEDVMGLEIVFFLGALLLLIALIYGTLNWHYRDRAAVRAAEEVTRRRYREEDVTQGELFGADSQRKVREPVGIEPEFSEDDIQRAQFGPRSVPGAADPAVMTPQREKKTPTNIDQGHVS